MLDLDFSMLEDYSTPDRHDPGDQFNLRSVVGEDRIEAKKKRIAAIEIERLNKLFPKGVAVFWNASYSPHDHCYGE